MQTKNFINRSRCHALALLATLVFLPAQTILAADTVTLRMATWLPAVHHLPGTLQGWFAEVEKASGGSLKIVLDPAPIAKPPAQYDITRDGVTDMAYHVLGYTPGRFSIIRGSELPFLSPNAEAGSQAVWDWYSRNIGFDKEFDDVKVVTLWVHGPGLVHAKKRVETLEDLAGLKLRVGGGGVAMSQALGAAPVAMSAPKAYESLQRGVTEGALFPWEAVQGFRLSEVVDHHLVVPGGLYTTPFVLIMNKDRWNALSDEHKKVLDEVGGLAGAKLIGQGWDAADQRGMEAAQKADSTILTLSDSEKARWAEKINFMFDDWHAKVKEQGADGPALMDDLKATMQRYNTN